MSASFRFVGASRTWEV